MTMPGAPCLDLSMRTATATTAATTGVAALLALGLAGIPDTAPTWSDGTFDAVGTCPTGTTLYDTENPDQGDDGILCRSTILTVF